METALAANNTGSQRDRSMARRTFFDLVFVGDAHQRTARRGPDNARQA